MPGPVIQAPKLPWWADPQQKSVMDPLAVTLARKAVGLLGLDDPIGGVMQAGMPASLMAGAPEVPGRVLQRLLAKHTVKVPPPIESTQIFKKMLSRVPEAEGKFETPVRYQLKRPAGAFNRYRQQAAIRQNFRPTPEEALAKELMAHPPAVTDAADLPTITTLATTLKPSHNPIIKTPSSGATKANSRRTFTPDMIRAIRKLTMKEALTQHPNIAESTLRGIRTRDTWNWVPD